MLSLNSWEQLSHKTPPTVKSSPSWPLTPKDSFNPNANRGACAYVTTMILNTAHTQTNTCTATHFCWCKLCADGRSERGCEYTDVPSARLKPTHRWPSAERKWEKLMWLSLYLGVEGPRQRSDFSINPQCVQLMKFRWFLEIIFNTY